VVTVNNDEELNAIFDNCRRRDDFAADDCQAICHEAVSSNWVLKLKRAKVYHAVSLCQTDCPSPKPKNRPLQKARPLIIIAPHFRNSTNLNNKTMKIIHEGHEETLSFNTFTSCFFVFSVDHFLKENNGRTI
jgi:hypothetical protein